jgi:hypothetical protein
MMATSGKLLLIRLRFLTKGPKTMKHYSFSEELSKESSQLNFMAEIGEVVIEGYNGRSLTIEADLENMTIDVNRQDDVVTVRVEQAEQAILEKITRLFSGPHSKAIVTIRVPYTCTVNAKTSTGKMRVSGLTAPVKATVITGQNDLADMDGPIDARVTTGSLNYTGALAPEQHRFAAVTGNINLALTEEPNGRLHARALTGDARCDFPLAEASVKQVIPGKQLRGILGDGSGRLDIRVTTGSLRLKKSESKSDGYMKEKAAL